MQYPIQASFSQFKWLCGALLTGVSFIASGASVFGLIQPAMAQQAQTDMIVTPTLLLTPAGQDTGVSLGQGLRITTYCRSQRALRGVPVVYVQEAATRMVGYVPLNTLQVGCGASTAQTLSRPQPIQTTQRFSSVRRGRQVNFAGPNTRASGASSSSSLNPNGYVQARVARNAPVYSVFQGRLTTVSQVNSGSTVLVNRSRVIRGNNGQNYLQILLQGGTGFVNESAIAKG